MNIFITVLVFDSIANRLISDSMFNALIQSMFDENDNVLLEVEERDFDTNPITQNLGVTKNPTLIFMYVPDVLSNQGFEVARLEGTNISPEAAKSIITQLNNYQPSPDGSGLINGDGEELTPGGSGGIFPIIPGPVGPNLFNIFPNLPKGFWYAKAAVCTYLALKSNTKLGQVGFGTGAAYALYRATKKKKNKELV